jgi:hypothetical protein
MTAETAWAHLPNAKHIDAVLADARKRPGAWGAARIAARRAAWGAAQRAAWDAAWGAAQRAARDAAWDAARDAAWDAAGDAAWDAARGAIAALVTWDSSADLLDCTHDVLRAMIDLAEPPVCHQAVLLLPYAIVRSTAKQEVT